jgi:Asp-tRNA(Asn)/Glu-tRNA(Gln) amidotransferase A subunit family amidase
MVSGSLMSQTLSHLGRPANALSLIHGVAAHCWINHVLRRFHPAHGDRMSKLGNDAMNQEVYYADATELAARIRGRELSPVEVVEAHLARIEEVNPRLNAVVCLADDALDKARQAEAGVIRGEFLPPLHGVPFTTKDCFDAVGLRTTRGSMLFADRVAMADATAVRRMQEAGAIHLGHTNMPEFAFWWETGNEIYGRTCNPWDLEMTCGGSSGGEAAAIAAGLSPLGLGSDVGGSIRQPSSFCGIVGLKPTHGRVPLTGQWPEVMLRYMHAGPMARSVRDVCLALSILSGPDGADPYALPVPGPGTDLSGDLSGLRVGWCAEGPFAPVDRQVQEVVSAAAGALEDCGCDVRPVELADWGQWQAQDISMSFFSGEGTTYLERFYRGREEELTWYIKRRLNLPIPSLNDFIESIENTERLRQSAAELFSRFDLLLVPTSPVTAFPHETAELEVNGQTVQGRNSLRATVPFDLTGSPAITVPFGFSEVGLPVGVQLAAAHFDEITLLRAAQALERMRPGADRRPTL